MGFRLRAGLLVLMFTVVSGAGAFAVKTNLPAAPAEVKHLDKLIQKLGVGPSSLVAVRLKDKTAVSGYVAEADADSMVLVNPKTGEETTVSYDQVDRMQGYNLESGTEVHQNTGIRSKLVRFAVAAIPGHQIPKNSFAGGTVLIVGIILGIILAIVLAKAL